MIGPTRIENFCDANGWSIVTAALLAETGHVDDALEMASLIPKSVFKSQGGDGNSLTNIHCGSSATRKQS